MQTKRDKQKGSSTSGAVSSHKPYSCSCCGSNKHASHDKACPALGKKCTLTGHFAHLCKTKASRIDAELAKSAATTSKNPRQCNNIQVNDSNEENSSSQIYSVATVNKISAQHKYFEVRLNNMPI